MAHSGLGAHTLGMPPPPQIHWLGQLPQLMVPPHPLLTVPQLRPMAAHAAVWVSVTQGLHSLSMASHRSVPLHVPHCMVPPQPSCQLPHVAPRSTQSSGPHVPHCRVMGSQTSPAGQAGQATERPQASMMEPHSCPAAVHASAAVLQMRVSS